MTLFLGCPMWGYKSWTGSFFPARTKARDFLRVYSRLLNTVEGNTTFYALPDAGTVQRWRDDAAPGFRFCLKVPQHISHQLKLVGAEAETEAFINRLALLGDKAGPSFLQLPPSFGARQLPALRSYLAVWPRSHPLAVEPRHADFFNNSASEVEFEALLAEHRVTRCIFDTRALFALPATHSAEVSEAQQRKPRFAWRDGSGGPFAFVRFVGQPELAANDSFLAPWIASAARRLNAGDACYHFFHMPDDTLAPELARRFHRLLSAQLALPELPAWGAETEARQGSLFD